MPTQSLLIPTGPHALQGVLSLPESPRGLVLFIHGSGSDHLSPRNRAVAAALETAGLASLLYDLRSQAEQLQDPTQRLQLLPMPLLRERVLQCLDWLWQQPSVGGLFPVGLFGSSTGAALALQAAASRPWQIGAVVCRGGRIDLAGAALDHVLAPTLLIVGSRDPALLALNRQARARLRCPNSLEVVEGADHLFTAAGSLQQVASLSCDWFGQWLQAGVQPPAARGSAGRASAPRGRVICR